jgi:class 3 adenylate cyclase
LEARVAKQLAELERTGKLRRFLAPQLADLIIAQGDESILESHRREIVVVFCDLRGFTAFAERAEPEEVMALLRDYDTTLGPIVARFEGTLDHYSGDGIMVFFNDPLPTLDPAKRAIEMAVAMREAAAEVVKAWRRRGHDIGFGAGISQGYATLGQIGFAERMDYTAIGTVTNLAALPLRRGQRRADSDQPARRDGGRRCHIARKNRPVVAKGAEPGRRRLQRGRHGNSGINFLIAGVGPEGRLSPITMNARSGVSRRPRGCTICESATIWAISGC